MTEQEYSTGDYRTIKDDYGELTQRLSNRSAWVNVSRKINGVTFLVGNQLKTIDFLLAFKAAEVTFRLNIMDDRIELYGGLPLLPEVSTPISDIHEHVLFNWLYDVGMTGEDKMKRAVSQASAMNAYHPIKEYLDGLVWDGNDYLAALFNKLTFENKESGEAFFKRWFIGSVAKIIEQGQNFMLVIDGPQGIGKSYLVRWLCPLPKYFIEGAVQPDDKDSYKRLMSSWIWEVGELEGTTRRSDRAALKDFITRQEITMRVAYGRHDITKPASASLVGTINEDGAGFLNDPTGSRRFAVTKLTSINYDYTKINKDQLWAQIYALYKAGEAWELTPDERKLQVDSNNSYEADSPVEQYLNLHFSWNIDDSNDQKNFMSSIEILETLKLAGLYGNDRANLMEISTVLKREGLQKKRVRGMTGFYGLVKNNIISGNYAHLEAKNADLSLKNADLADLENSFFGKNLHE
jgi:predicted P-loop ATPase